jgi:hypothetical protein
VRRRRSLFARTPPDAAGSFDVSCVYGLAPRSSVVVVGGSVIPLPNFRYGVVDSGTTLIGTACCPWGVCPARRGEEGDV